MLEFTNYGQQRDLICTEEERQIFSILQELAGTDLELVRKSDNYVTALLGEWDLARIKYTNRAKWIQFPIFDRGSEKHRIGAVEDARGFADMVTRSIEHIKEYS